MAGKAKEKAKAVKLKFDHVTVQKKVFQQRADIK